MTTKSGDPVRGIPSRIIVDEVEFKDSAGSVTQTVALNELSSNSRKRVLTWALKKVVPNQNAFEVKIIEDVIQLEEKFYTEYKVVIKNRTPMDLPSDLVIAYNIHRSVFSAKNIPNSKDRYRFTFNKSSRSNHTQASIYEHNGVPAATTVNFVAKSAHEDAGSAERPVRPSVLVNKLHSRVDGGMSKIPPHMTPEKAKQFGLEPKRIWMRVRSRVLQFFEIRVMYNDEVLYQDIFGVDNENYVEGRWKNPGEIEEAEATVAATALSREPIVEPEEEKEVIPVVEEIIPKIPVPKIPYGSIVIIDTNGGTGTGFLLKLRDQDFLVTNIHVIAGANTVICKTVSGAEIKLPKEFFISKDRDLAILPINHSGKYLESLADISESVEIGDEVTVFGNEAGASVMTQRTGVVKGVGPTRIETDAKFIEGNSGSPAIHHETGKVIGIAAFYLEYEIPDADRTGIEQPGENESTEGQNRRSGEEDEASKEAAEPEPEKIRRRFAERIDNASAWESASLSLLRQEQLILDEYSTMVSSYALIAVGIMHQKRVLKATEVNHPGLQEYLNEFHAHFKNTRQSGSDGNTRALERLKRELNADIDALRNNVSRQLKTAYFKHEYKRVAAFDVEVRKYMEGVASY